MGEIEEKKAGRTVLRVLCTGLFLDRRRVARTSGCGMFRSPRPRCSAREEAPIAPPGEISSQRRCAVPSADIRNDRHVEHLLCLRNRARGKRCRCRGPDGQTDRVVRDAATHSRAARSLSIRTRRRARYALRIDKGYASLEQAQDWLGYDFLKADLFTDARKPMNLDVEIRDTATRRLLDAGQLHDGRAARQEHADHSGQATLCRREVSAGADADLERDHPAGLRHRRQSARAAVPRQHPSGA